MNTSNKKRKPITDKYIDSEGREQLRASSLDYGSLLSRHYSVLDKVIPGIIEDHELFEKLCIAKMVYEKGHYEEAFQHLNWLIINKPLLEPFLYYYKKRCEHVLSLNPDSIDIKNKIRCKWCGNFTSYIDPNISTFGLIIESNLCSSCGRIYPMPSWMWDSPDGRAYSYYRGSFIDEEFYKEFEEDYEPKPLCNRYQKQEFEEDYKTLISFPILNAESYYNEGLAKYRLGDNQGAIQDYCKAIQIDPNFLEAFSNRGSAKNNLGDYRGAIQDFSKAIELNPNIDLGYKDRGMAKNNLEDYRGAVQDFNKAIEINPHNDFAYYYRGIAKRFLGDYRDAIQDYGRAIEINPHNADAYNYRGNAKNILKDHAGAVLDFNNAIELNPNIEFAYYNRGLAKSYLKDYIGAIKDFDKAIELNSNIEFAFYNRGLAQMILGEYRLAIFDFDMALLINPNYSEAYHNRGIAKFNMGWILSGSYDMILKYFKRLFK